MRYLVTYDLSRPGQSYDNLINAIKLYPNATHVMQSVWFLKSANTASQIQVDLKRYMDANDLIFITEIPSNMSGYLQKPALNFLAL